MWRARAALRWLKFFPNQWKPTAPARRPSPSVHGRALTGQPRRPTSSFLTHVRKMKRHRVRSLSREEAQHARLRRMRASPRWLDSVHDLWKPTALARRPSPSVHGHSPTCQPWPPTSSSLTHVRKKKTPLRAFALPREVAPHARLRRARARCPALVEACPGHPYEAAPAPGLSCSGLGRGPRHRPLPTSTCGGMKRPV